ncbi:MAG: aminopeptidase [Acetobacteraceae bacterium]|nr:aminopeptidase [Acetobacteraceae bacterium]
MDMHPRPNTTPHDARLDRLAEVAVRVGLGLQAGQEVVLTAPIDAAPLVRRITEHAYRAGAKLVSPLFSDEQSTLARFQFAPDEAFDYAPGWLYDGMARAFEAGAARLAIGGEDPTLLSGQDADRVARANRSRSVAYRPALELITNFAVNWNIVCYATPSWARVVFPDLPEAEGVARLWDAIFAASRIDDADPVAAWAAHNAALHARTAALNEKRFASLHFSGPGTDLTVGLAEGHLWLGGSEPSKNGIVCNPNIPSEEVFTTPHAGRVDGVVRSTKPLSYQGTLIEGIEVRFEQGRIVQSASRTGHAVLERVLGTDEGARRLGEVALVPHSSPISASGLLFFNTLFDENAASHIALGQSYRTCIEDGTSASDAELVRRGANSSLIHIDWMIGSGEVDVDGIDDAGSRQPVMRKGEFV